jgi:hypothetical protein
MHILQNRWKNPKQYDIYISISFIKNTVALQQITSKFSKEECTFIISVL